ncbi:Hook-filament junction protein [Serratia plymuthica]|uniref:Hook-filament junction protein n=1 Tax=Serratia plymuthica TaxID=82996 RepID=A0A2X4V301_SERPL|nr:Hook-filament junction protein [Serratia plymuthica]
MAKANRGLDNSYNKVLSVRAELGNQLQEMDTLDSIGKDRDMINQTQMSALVDADLTESISSYFMQQALCRHRTRPLVICRGCRCSK